MDTYILYTLRAPYDVSIVGSYASKKLATEAVSFWNLKEGEYQIKQRKIITERDSEILKDFISENFEGDMLEYFECSEQY